MQNEQSALTVSVLDHLLPDQAQNGVANTDALNSKGARQVTNEVQNGTPTTAGTAHIYTSWRDKWETVSFSMLPPWLQDNGFILRHHRPQLQSLALCFLSVFRLHTESVNIWTHLIGMIAVAVYMAYSLKTLDGTKLDLTVFSVFFVTAFICFSNSTLFHILSSHSPTVAGFFNRLDYCSIVILTVGSFISWLYYLFYCELTLRIVYLSVLGFLGFILCIVFLFKRFTKPRYRFFRAAAFVGLGVSGVIPILHMLYRTGFDYAIHKLSMGWLVLLAGSYILGAIIYAKRIPERWLPGTFDLLFQSHHFLHLSTLVSVTCHTYGLWKLANFMITEDICLPTTM